MRQDKPFGAPESYDSCPVCLQEFRKCPHTWEAADKAHLRRQQRKVLAGKKSNDIARVVIVEDVTLYLWHDGRVTWGESIKV
jgi:hypothetical protein